MVALVIVIFLPLVLVLLLAMLPAKGLTIGPTPRIWPVLGGTVGFVGGALYFGVSHLSEPLRDAQTGELIADAGWRIELLMASLGGLFGCFAGVVVFQSMRTILLRALHNARRLRVARQNRS